MAFSRTPRTVKSKDPRAVATRTPLGALPRGSSVALRGCPRAPAVDTCRRPTEVSRVGCMESSRTLSRPRGGVSPPRHRHTLQHRGESSRSQGCRNCSSGLPLSRKGSLMPQKIKMIALASAVLSGLAFTPAIAAEREQVRAVINLIAAVKMPFPEGFERDVARTEYVRLDGRSETVACLRVDDKVRWCYEHIPALGSRAEMLRIRNEPVDGIRTGQLFQFVVDYDLDGLV